MGSIRAGLRHPHFGLLTNTMKPLAKVQLPTTKPNITMDEFKAFKGGPVQGSVNNGQRGGNDHHGKKDYMDKAFGLLSDSSTYRTIPKFPPSKLKNISSSGPFN